MAFAAALVFSLSFQAAPAIAYGHQVVASGIAVAKPATTWPDFRGSPTNNAVTDAATPRTTAEAGLVWSAKFGAGYVSPAIIVDDEIVVTSGRSSKGKISKLNKKTGKLVAEANMRNGSTYSLIPPTYADGKIFVTLSGGGIEAFDAKTLKSLWYYQNAAGGQGNCPVVYSGGRVYTGFWSGETAERSFVCVDAETGTLVWERANAGGYYWAGGLVVGDYLLFGCDDGKSADAAGKSFVRCVDKATGAVVSSVEVEGDQRSSIVYGSDQGRIYFTSKPGNLYSVKLDPETGILSDRQSLKIGAETTATPLAYGNRVYVGASSGGFAEGSLSVVDASSLGLLYQLDGASGIGGAVKSAPLMSTAYADAAGADGKLYLYLTVNNLPGGITMVAVEPNSTTKDQARVVSLFTPPAALQQYCIASVICDDEGNLYYRNDSNFLMCVGPGGEDPGDVDVPSNDQPSDPSGGSSGGKGGSSDPSKPGSNGTPTPSGDDVSRSGDGGSSNNGGDVPRGGDLLRGGARPGASGGSPRPEPERKQGVADGPVASEGDAFADRSGNARHTDAVAATGHLDDTPDQGAPEWLVPAIVAGAAIVALIAVFAVRTVFARRSLEGGEAFEGAEEPGGPHGH